MNGSCRRVAIALALTLFVSGASFAARGGGSGGGHSHGHHGGHHHGHSSVGFYFGGWPYYSPWYDWGYPYPGYPYGGYGYWPYAYAPPYSAAYYYGSGYAPAWVEQQQETWWYYCAPLDAYYPYVTQCPDSDWRRVSPQPAPGSAPSNAPAR